jgi:hypothetical protein
MCGWTLSSLLLLLWAAVVVSLPLSEDFLYAGIQSFERYSECPQKYRHVFGCFYSNASYASRIIHSIDSKLFFNDSIHFEKLRGQSIFVVGYSLVGLQFMALGCRLWEIDSKTIFKEGKGTHIYYSPTYDLIIRGCTAYSLLNLRDQQLYLLSDPSADHEKITIDNNVILALKGEDYNDVDYKFRKPNVLVISAGHHYYTHYYQDSYNKIHDTNYTTSRADYIDFRIAIKIVNKFLKEFSHNGELRVIWRSNPPRQFYDGDWNTDGHCSFDHPCNRTQLQEWIHDEQSISGVAMRFTSIIHESAKVNNFEFFDVTDVSIDRCDAMVGSALPRQSLSSDKTKIKVHDCTHYCMPGVPDIWNRIMVERFFEK